jgi:hypothetical protein
MPTSRFASHKTSAGNPGFIASIEATSASGMPAQQSDRGVVVQDIDPSGGRGWVSHPFVQLAGA